MANERMPIDETTDSRAGDGDHHATTGGAAAAGAATGAVVGMAAAVGAAVGAVGGAIAGAAAERAMHADDDREGERMGLPNDGDGNVMIEDRAKERGAMAGGTMASGTAHVGGERTVRLHEEELTPVKERVQTGEVEVRKEVITETKTIDVPVTREEVVIERRPVTPRPADTADFRAEGETIRVPVTEERVRVEKTPVVTEEVTVGTRATQEMQTVSGTVRREEARVEQSGDIQVRGGDPKHAHQWASGNTCSCGASR